MTHPFASADSIDRTFNYQATCNQPGNIYFDRNGIPRCTDPETVFLEQFERNAYPGRPYAGRHAARHHRSGDSPVTKKKSVGCAVRTIESRFKKHHRMAGLTYVEVLIATALIAITPDSRH